MSVTVADCLKLSSLREAKLVAGQRGLNNIVAYVSVLEYANVAALVDCLFMGNELIITAFISVMDDVESQCAVLRRLQRKWERWG